METLKHTPIHRRHLELGAKMVDFAGWAMPVQYESIIKEHNHVRNHVGLFDICHMGEFIVSGPDTIPFLQKISTNDVSTLINGKSQYACMCYDKTGTVVDDLIYYQIDPEDFRIIVNADNIQKDFNWLKKNRNGFNIKLENQSEQRSRFALQGPDAEKFFNPLVDVDLTEVKRFNFVESNNLFIARTGYTGEDGFEITCDISDAVKTFDLLMDNGVKPIGLGARDSLRLEYALSLYGHEINEEITPVEASIGWVVKKKQDIDFNGKEILLNQKKEGTKRKIVGINLVDKGIIRTGFKVFDSNGENEIGYVTSGAYIPSLSKSVGLAILSTEYTTIDTEIQIEIRNKLKKGITVKTPFK